MVRLRPLFKGKHGRSLKGRHGVPINGIVHFYDPQQKYLKLIILNNFDPLWAWQNLWGYGRKVHAKFWPWGTPWDPIYDHLGLMLSARM